MAFQSSKLKKWVIMKMEDFFLIPEKLEVALFELFYIFSI